jgi:protein TonB
MLTSAAALPRAEIIFHNKTMALDSSTLCARTAAGEAELATPSQGLALGQRRVLTLLQNPIAVDELAQRHRLEPEKLARDLTRLADLRLVVLQGPSIPTAPPLAPLPLAAVAKDAASMAPVVIGSSARRMSMLPLVGGVAALVVAAGIWYGTRGNPAPSESPKPTAAAPAPSLAPAPGPGTLAPVAAPLATNAVNPVATDAPSAPPLPATAFVLRNASNAAAVRTPVRSETATTAPASAKVALAADAPAPKAAQRPEATTGAPSTAPAAAPPAPPAPAAAASPVPAPAAEAPPPVHLAAAAPTSAPRAPAPTELKPISREPPDFPKEAIADGYKSGIVNARIHVDARGSVTGVDIMGSQPPKVFDRAARRALLRWQFEPNAVGQSADLDVDVKFQRD